MTSTDSLFAQGVEFHKTGNYDAAKLHYYAVLRSQPTHISAIAALADVFNHQNNLQAGIALLSRAVAVVPGDPNLLSAYGNFLKRAEDYQNAEKALNQAIELAPDDITAWHNKFLLSLRQHKTDEVLKCYQQICDLGGDSPSVQNDLAHTYLSRGELEKALQIYDSRWNILFHLEPWDLRLPEWHGQDVTGKRVLVHHEQGFGDTIMTSRFVRDLVQKGAKVTFAVPPTLIDLFDCQDWGIEVCNIADLDQSRAQDFDYHTPLYSMMRWLGVNVEDISSAPYLAVPPVTTPPVFEELYNVGICWSSGYRGDKMDWRRRVSPLEDWLTLAAVPKVQLWSLFPGGEAQDNIMRCGAEALVLDEVTRLSSFAQTANFISKLDLVISVDTAVAHIAAALGKNVWMLSQFTHCWRWWDIDNASGRPWYSSMVIAKQTSPGDWKEQLQKAKSALEVVVGARS
jgi:hypothetical protein